MLPIKSPTVLPLNEIGFFHRNAMKPTIKKTASENFHFCIVNWKLSTNLICIFQLRYFHSYLNILVFIQINCLTRNRKQMRNMPKGKYSFVFFVVNRHFKAVFLFMKKYVFLGFFVYFL